jgi:hypothetical protein
MDANEAEPSVAGPAPAKFDVVQAFIVVQFGTYAGAELVSATPLDTSRLYLKMPGETMLDREAFPLAYDQILLMRDAKNSPPAPAPAEPEPGPEPPPTLCERFAELLPRCLRSLIGI